MNTNQWIQVRHSKPAEGQVVETKIDDQDGCRNEAKLKRQGRLWFHPGGDFYVYYEPTHWRECTGE